MEDEDLFIIAEYNKVKGNIKEAIRYYDKAIEKAIKNENFKNKALFYLYAGKFYLSTGSIYAGKHYITEAYYAFKQWGADGKVEQMREKYKDYIDFSYENITSNTTSSSTTSGTITGRTTDKAFDISSIMKASQAVSGEIILDKLLSKMIKIVAENAGADKGYLILPGDNNELLIEAEINIEKNETNVLQSQPVENSKKLAESIVNYCFRTKEYIRLDDAEMDKMYAKDKYIKQNKIKSVLCMPLINQGKLSGLIYLENTLTKGAFTENRLELLQMLSGQMAISIENAKLYHTLEETHKFKSAFYANMSHELRTPMNQINGIAEGLLFGVNNKTDEMAEELENVIDIIEEQKENTELTEEINKLKELLEEEENIKHFVFENLENKIISKISDDNIKNNIKEIFSQIYEFIEEEELEYLSSYKQIKKSGDNLVGLIDMILNMSETSSITKIMSKKEVEIKKLLDDLLNEINNLIKEQNKEQKLIISKQMGEDVPVKISVDEKWTIQILKTILYNSVIFTDEGTIKFNITSENNSIMFRITDTGIGIKDKDKNKIFTEFGKTGYRKDLEGAGLSLALSKRLVSMQGGKIGFESEYGKGSTFWFSLPVD